MTWFDTGNYGRLSREIADEDAGWRIVCRVFTKQNVRSGSTRDDTEPWPEGEENFRLILQAPKMLEALCSIRDQVECFMQPLPDGVARARWEAVRNHAVAAIAAVARDRDKHD